MAQVKILMHSLGDEQYVVDTFYVKGYDNEKEIIALMTELGMPPSDWNSGYYYTAVIDSTVDSKDAMTLDEFRKHLRPVKTRRTRQRTAKPKLKQATVRRKR